MTEILFTGDLLLSEPIHVNFDLHKNWIPNLEAPITREVTGIPGTVNLRMVDNHLDRSFAHAPLAVSIANNHIMDFGETGLSDTVAEMNRMGAVSFGAGHLIDNCRNPVVVSAGPHKVGMCAYVCPTAHPVFASAGQAGVKPIDVSQIEKDMATARDLGANHIAVILHWGVEELGLPRPSDVLVGRAVIDLGADIVIGHHAHCIQPYEIYKGRYIFYGLGNWATPDLVSDSYFDEDGVSTACFRKRQRYWNNRSLGAVWNVDTGAVDIQTFRFQTNVLSRESTMSSGKYRLELLDWRTYERKFKVAYAASVLRNKVYGYAADPKMPKLRHLKSLMNIARESVNSQT